MPRISSDQRMSDLKIAIEEHHVSFTNYMEARRAYDTCLKHMQMRVVSKTVAHERLPSLLEARTKTADVLRQKWTELKTYMRIVKNNKSF